MRLADLRMELRPYLCCFCHLLCDVCPVSGDDLVDLQLDDGLLTLKVSQLRLGQLLRQSGLLQPTTRRLQLHTKVRAGWAGRRRWASIRIKRVSSASSELSYSSLSAVVPTSRFLLSSSFT